MLFFIFLTILFSFEALGLSECGSKNKKNCLLEFQKQSVLINELNINKKPLIPCSLDPITGLFRDGYCRYDSSDRGRHLVCAEVTSEFLKYTKTKGNDLSTPNPRYNFEGLRPGDRWCLCVTRVEDANREGIPLRVLREATNIKSGF